MYSEAKWLVDPTTLYLYAVENNRNDRWESELVYWHAEGARALPPTPDVHIPNKKTLVTPLATATWRCGSATSGRRQLTAVGGARHTSTT